MADPGILWNCSLAACRMVRRWVWRRVRSGESVRKGEVVFGDIVGKRGCEVGGGGSGRGRFKCAFGKKTCNSGNEGTKFARLKFHKSRGGPRRVTCQEKSFTTTNPDKIGTVRLRIQGREIVANHELYWSHVQLVLCLTLKDNHRHPATHSSNKRLPK